MPRSRSATANNSNRELKYQAALNTILSCTANQLRDLPFKARELLIESFATLLLRSVVPMSGMTVQQHISAAQNNLDQLNLLMQKNNAYRNDYDAVYAYQYPREATSAGVIPAYKDQASGDIYVGLICNKRNLQMYNWSAGYTEAPLPIWREKLLAEREDALYYNREKLKNAALQTMAKILAEANGDWTKVEYSYARFEKDFNTEGVSLPQTDINSFHTASRECLEEIGLDLSQFPGRKTFLISHDNTLGISQGDAPDQLSDRHHQYLVYLGTLRCAPEISPGDDVAIADWINVSQIFRKNPTEYYANNKPLCIYMLRGLELSLKNLWNHLLEEESTRVSHYTNKPVVHFSCLKNLAAKIEEFCNQNEINIAGTLIPQFLEFLEGDLAFSTYTGKTAQILLNCILRTADYLLSPELDVENFIQSMTQILSPLEQISAKKARCISTIIGYEPT